VICAATMADKKEDEEIAPATTEECASKPCAPQAGSGEFVSRLFDLVENKRYPNACSFNEAGEGLIIHSTFEMEKTVLPEIFQHTNYSSFVRQLNVYGFSKNRMSETIEFTHPGFRRNRPDLLPSIRRKSKRALANISGGAGTSSRDGSDSADITRLRDELDELKNRLARSEEALFRAEAQAHVYISEIQNGAHMNAHLARVNSELMSLLREGNGRSANVPANFLNSLMVPPGMMPPGSGMMPSGLMPGAGMNGMMPPGSGMNGMMASGMASQFQTPFQAPGRAAALAAAQAAAAPKPAPAPATASAPPAEPQPKADANAEENGNAKESEEAPPSPEKTEAKE